ncbi:MAG TPA: HAD family hydrolase [bacterium]|nr:HAD family hydrolase [bacterium]
MRPHFDRPLAGVIFDLGGTLIYPVRGVAEEVCAAHLESWLRAEGWPVEVGPAIRDARTWLFEMTRKTGRQFTMHEAIRRAAQQLGRQAPDAQFVHRAERAFYEPELADYRAFPDALPLLRRLRAARLRLACISNTSSDWIIQQIVDRMGFGPLFDQVVSSAAYGRVKPDPGIFRTILSRWGISPGRVAMVGDTLLADVAGGRGVGMRTVCVTMTPNPDNVNHPLINADADAATLTEAEQILFRWMS